MLISPVTGSITNPAVEANVPAVPPDCNVGKIFAPSLQK